MYAIVDVGSKQYRVEVGQVLDVEKLPAAAGGKITLDKVLFFTNGSGPQIGQPYVTGAKVVADVVAQDRDEKVVVFKFKHKVNYHRKKGHRQFYTRLKIAEIVGPGTKE